MFHSPSFNFIGSQEHWLFGIVPSEQTTFPLRLTKNQKSTHPFYPPSFPPSLIMKFATLLNRRKPSASLGIEKDTLGPAVAPSSQQTFKVQAEKESSLSSNSQHEGEPRIVETSPSDEAQTSESHSDEPEYPSGWKLGIIMISLALSVFLMALVVFTLSFSPLWDLRKISTHCSSHGEPWHHQADHNADTNPG